MPEGSSRPGGGQRRPGSRLLLALALAAVVPAAMCGGALLAEAVASLLGVASAPLRLALKVLLIASALPAGFYLVERLFLSRASRPRKKEEPGGS